MKPNTLKPGAGLFILVVILLGVLLWVLVEKDATQGIKDRILPAKTEPVSDVLAGVQTNGYTKVGVVEGDTYTITSAQASESNHYGETVPGFSFKIPEGYSADAVRREKDCYTPEGGVYQCHDIAPFFAIVSLVEGDTIVPAHLQYMKKSELITTFWDLVKQEKIGTNTYKIYAPKAGQMDIPSATIYVTEIAPTVVAIFEVSSDTFPTKTFLESLQFSK